MQHNRIKLFSLQKNRVLGLSNNFIPTSGCQGKTKKQLFVHMKNEGYVFLKVHFVRYK